MHMDDPGMGMDTNYAFARDYWYICAGVIGLLTAAQGVKFYAGRQR